MNLKHEFLYLIQALNQAKVQYAVCGGLALSVYGFARATEDIDLLTSKDQLPDLTQIANNCGFHIPGDSMTFRRDENETVIHRISKAQGQDLLTLDLIEVTEYLKTVWESRELFTIGDVECWVVSREGLIEMKRVSGRSQDQVDIERLQNNEQ